MIDLVLGIGCTRGATAAFLKRGTAHVLATHGFALAQVRALASIAGKRDEPGLVALAVECGWTLGFYTREELSSVNDLSYVSERVQRATGAPSVAEPAARLHAGGPLLVPTTRYREPDDPARMTVAVARMERSDG